MECERENLKNFLIGHGVLGERVEAAFKDVKCRGTFPSNEAFFWDKWRINEPGYVVKRFALCEPCNDAAESLKYFSYIP